MRHTTIIALLSSIIACHQAPEAPGGPGVPAAPPTPRAEAGSSPPAADGSLPAVVAPSSGAGDARLLGPEDFEYVGAFRLPEGTARPTTFEYGGNAMTFRPSTPGSLYVMGHDRLPYGELPDGGQVAEISIPAPVVSKDLADLPRASFLQPFANVTGGLFEGLDEIPRAGIAYLDAPETGPKVHLTWGAHFQEDAQHRLPSQAWFGTDLGEPAITGAWQIGQRSLYGVNGYLFALPRAWADEHTGGRPLASGRYRDGGWGGKGPALYAYAPWADSDGTPEPAGATLSEAPLLEYGSSLEDESVGVRSMVGYQHADEWEGGGFLTAGTRSAVMFAGTKGVGDRFWYGFLHPDGQEPCVEVGLVDQFTTCWNADGTLCAEEDLQGCEPPASYRGWWSSAYAARLILYDPADLAQVAAGTKAAWEPQPYAHLDIDEHLLLPSVDGEALMLGSGLQRRYRIGAVAFDSATSRLFVLELFADAAAPVVHVFQLHP